jgi:hypothetical protein
VPKDDTLRLTTTEPANIGGRRWWFVCPRSNRRVRHLYLPLGCRYFRSRRAYRLGYAVERLDKHDRAFRRVGKLYLRLGGDPVDSELPAKPKRMRWATYARLIAELDAAQRAADVSDPLRLAVR